MGRRPPRARSCSRPETCAAPHAPLSQGTLGATVYYQDKRCLLTNCHVIGDWDLWPGRRVYQPEFNPDPTSKDGDLIGVCDGTFEVFSYGAPNPDDLLINVFGLPVHVLGKPHRDHPRRRRRPA